MKRIKYNLENVLSELKNGNVIYVHLESTHIIVVDVITKDDDLDAIMNEDVDLPPHCLMTNMHFHSADIDIDGLMADNVQDLKEPYVNDIATDIAYKITKLKELKLRPLFGPVWFEKCYEEDEE